MRAKHGNPREGGSEDVHVSILLHSFVLIDSHLSHLRAAEHHTGHIGIVRLDVHPPAVHASPSDLLSVSVTLQTDGRNCAHLSVQASTDRCAQFCHNFAITVAKFAINVRSSTRERGTDRRTDRQTGGWTDKQACGQTQTHRLAHTLTALKPDDSTCSVHQVRARRLPD